MSTRRILAVFLASIVLLPTVLAAQPYETNRGRADRAKELTERDPQTKRYNACTQRCDDRLMGCQERSNSSTKCSQEYSSCSRGCEKIIH